MSKRSREKTVLGAGDRVCVVGGGPAGAFFAIHLLRQARAAGRPVAVTVIEKKSRLRADAPIWLRRGCNHCAGGISPRLHDLLHEHGLDLPPALVQEEFTHIWIHGLWKNFPLRIPRGRRMTAVFRGALPGNRTDGRIGLDHFLLEQASREGAAILDGEVREIRRLPSGIPVVQVKTSREDSEEIAADFVAIAVGINPRPGQALAETGLFRSCQALMPRFRPPGARRTLVFELKPGRSYLRKHMHREIYFIESGSKRLALEHIALVPKGDYLTVALVGKSIDRADLPKDARKLVREFMALPHIRTILPHLPPKIRPSPVRAAPTWR